MISREQVLKALEHIQEPQLRRSMTELNLFRDVVIKEGQVRLTAVLSSPDEERKETLRREIERALKSLEDVEVYVRFRQMTDVERAETERKLAGGEAGQQRQAQTPRQHTHAEGLTSPLLSPESKTRFIAIASGKGGVGKSTVTANLAVAMARLGKKVGIIDADIYGFSIPDMMGIEEGPKLENDRIIPVERFGVKVISMGFFVENNAPVIWRGPMLGKMLRNFFAEVEWGEVEYMLLDLPPGTGDIALDVHQMIPQSKEIIVTTPHATAAFVAARAGAMALHTKHEILGVIENMAYYECSKCGQKDYIFGRRGGAKLAEELHSELLGQIPLGMPENHPQEPDYSPSVYKASTPIGETYQSIAQRVIEKLG
jgi:ATP-binding protein involved in chromosome partitioning